MVLGVDLIILGVNAVLLLGHSLCQVLRQVRWVVLCRLASAHLVDGIESFQRVMEKMAFLPLLATRYLLGKTLFGGFKKSLRTPSRAHALEVAGQPLLHRFWSALPWLAQDMPSPIGSQKGPRESMIQLYMSQHRLFSEQFTQGEKG